MCSTINGSIGSVVVSHNEFFHLTNLKNQIQFAEYKVLYIEKYPVQ